MFGIKSIACEYDLRGRKTYEGGATYPVRYEYDSDANISRIDYSDATIAFMHDADGLLTSVSNTVGVVSNEYDSVTGWLVSSHGADGVDVSYTYHLGGDVASISSPAGIVSNTLDVAGRKSELFTPAGNIGFGYCPWNGRLAVVTNVNGTTTSYAYDVMDRVTNITWTTADGSRIGGFAYSYDALGRILSRSHDIGSNVFNRFYSYDAMDRLASDDNVSYAYDAAGNRMMKIGDVEGEVSYTLGVGDRLASWTGGSYTYDDAGCVTRIERVGKPTLDLTWNSKYQLVSVATNGVFAEGYAYDALGRRVDTTTLEGMVRHVYDNNWQCIADMDVNGNVLCSYVWGDGIDNLLAVRIGDETYTALTDIQGTVRGFTDGNGEVVARWTYDAWGNVLSSDVTVPALAALRYRFQGREWSVVTGLMNFRMRWYDAVTGRWLSKDPLGLEGWINQYVFCANDPVNYGDFLGLSPGRNAHKWAKGQIGSGHYNEWGGRGWPFWWGKYKCNLFVADAYNRGNGKAIIPTGRLGTQPTRARGWQEGIGVPSGFKKTDKPQTGDVASDGTHMGIVSVPGETTISASSDLGAVVENDWGFRAGQDDVVFWHYE